MEQVESRTLLSAGAIDPTYSAVFDGWRMPVAFSSQIHPQLDGKMLHYAYIGPTDAGIQFWRTNPNGSLDKTFGYHGVINLGDTNSGAMEVTDFQVQSDGKFVALTHTDGKSIQLRRFNANGRPDRSFGRGGRVGLDTRDGANFGEIAIQNDGKILAVGNDISKGYIRRFNINGSVDTSFATGGTKTILPQNEAGWVGMGGIDIRRNDNRIVFAYSYHLGSDYSLAELQVLSPNGALEWNYQGAPMSNDYSAIGTVMVDGDGSIVVAGNAKYSDASDDYGYHNYIVRHPAQKSTAGLIWSTQSEDFSGTLVPQGDGRILTTRGPRIVRLNYNLTTDSSFASGGTYDTGWDSLAVALQGDGKIVADGGQFVSRHNPHTNFHSLRLIGDGPFAVASKKTVKVSGTSGNDQINISKSRGVISVTLNGLDPLLFSAKKTKGLAIDAGSGNDTIRLGNTSPTSFIDGGEGDDTLIGKRSKDRLTSIEHS
jgi:uncharacterized delta-60 repeat protein